MNDYAQQTRSAIMMGSRVTARTSTTGHVHNLMAKYKFNEKIKQEWAQKWLKIFSSTTTSKHWRRRFVDRGKPGQKHPKHTNGVKPHYR